MTLSMILRTLLEILLFAALVYGFFNEDKLDALEQQVICRIKRRRLRVVEGSRSHRYTVGE